MHSGFIHFSRGIGLFARKRSLDRAKGKENAKIGKKEVGFLFEQALYVALRCVLFFFFEIKEGFRCGRSLKLSEAIEISFSRLFGSCYSCRFP